MVKPLYVWALVVVGLAPLCPTARAQLTGELGAHDPSSVIKDGSTYYYFATGPGIVSRSSTNLTAWAAGPSVFGTPPAWTTQAVPGFAGTFWAPDVAYWDGQFHLYYAVSTWGSKVSAIGEATSPTLNPAAANYGWTDHGAAIQSNNSTPFNAIDPSVLVDPTTNRIWMSYGSYNNGIYVTEIDRTTGKPKAGAANVNVAVDGPVEGSSLEYRNGYYYLLTSVGGCCSDVHSTYNIYVGRSTSPTGPFLDKNGVNMVNGGGTLFLDDNGKVISPGHFERLTDNGQDYFSFHYYNGDAVGAPTFGLRKLYWTADGWPSVAAVNPDWTGTTSTSWGLSSNWSVDGVPNGVGHVANFGSVSSGRYVVGLDTARTVGTVNFSGNAGYTIGTNANLLTLDADTGDAATINVSAGSHTIAAPLNAVDPLGVNVFSGSRLTLSGGVSANALTKYGFGTLALDGTSAFTGTVLVKWGTMEVNGSVSASQFTSVGQIFAENATMVVHGTGSFTTSADLNIGDTGNATDPAIGTLVLQDNARITINSTGAFFVGSGYFANTRAVGTVNQSGGTLTANSSADGAFVIGGRNSNLAAGAYNLSGGTVNANTNVRVGGLGAGTLNISGNGQMTVTGLLYLAYAGGSTGTVNLDGGTLTASRIARGTGDATFNFNGGALRAGGNSTAFLQGLSNAYLKAGGAVIDTQAFSVTVAQPLLHDPSLGTTPDGGLTKAGGGMLTITGSNTYTGGTTVRGGTLQITPGSLPSTANVTIGKGAVLDLNGAVQQVRSLTGAGGSAVTLGSGQLIVNSPVNTQFAGTISGSGGSLVKQGTGVLTLTGPNTYTGPTTVSSGVLRLAQLSGIPIANTAVANYSFDNVAGSTVVNGGAGGATMNGTLAGGATIVAGGHTGNAVSVANGASVNINNPVASLGNAGNWTVSAWVKTATPGGSILTKGDGSGWSAGNTIFYLGDGTAGGSGGIPSAVRWGGGFYQGSTSAAPVTDNTWHQVTYVNGGGSYAIYVDGLAQPLAPGNAGFATADVGSVVRLGITTNTVPTDGTVNFNGLLDDVQIYNQALTGDQIAALFQGSSSGSLPATTQVSIAAGATLDVNGMTQQIAALSGPTGSAVTLGAGQLIVNSATSTQFAGTISGAGGSLVKGGTGTLTLAGNNSYTGSTTVNGGMLRVNGSVAASSKIFVAGTGTFEAAGATQTLKSAAVAAGGTLRIAPTVGGPARQLIVGDGTHTFADAATSALAISGGTVDVSNNALVVRFAPGNDLAAAAAIRGYIVSARNGPAADWQGPGITSGTAIADPGKLAVGYALSSELLGPSGGTFMGAPVDGSSVLVRATLGGDATLDGRVDFADLVQVAQHYGTSATADVGWLQGDFDYNGTVDFADLVRLAQNYNGSLPAAPVPGAAAGFQADLAVAFAAVPEPGAALGVIALVGVLAVRRRH